MCHIFDAKLIVRGSQREAAGHGGGSGGTVEHDQHLWEDCKHLYEMVVNGWRTGQSSTRRKES